ncbi:MAG: biopolymer transporter ExbD, partial [Phaeodactylibacter sp.]|nr:biopolymer transporter ExbD [Phaeodactylibacter sp.]
EFSMSSLTDIIFLLLIFFKLTSSLVAPNALNLKLPGTSQNRSSTPSKLDDVAISSSGSYYLNGQKMALGSLDQELAKRARRSSTTYAISISPETQTPTEYVVNVMDIGLRYHINTVLAAAPE